MREKGVEGLQAHSLFFVSLNSLIQLYMYTTYTCTSYGITTDNVEESIFRGEHEIFCLNPQLPRWSIQNTHLTLLKSSQLVGPKKHDIKSTILLPLVAP